MSITSREKLTAVALRLLDEFGRDAVLLQALGKKAGVSKTAPYRHFKGKHDILETMALTSVKDMNAALEEAAHQRLSPVEALKLVMHEYLAYASRFAARYKMMIEEANAGREDSELRSEVRRTFQTVAHLV